jgi:hypothetical protein
MEVLMRTRHVGETAAFQRFSKRFRHSILFLMLALLLAWGCTRNSHFHDDELDGLDGRDDTQDLYTPPDIDGFIFDDTQEWDLPEGAECPDGALRCSGDGLAVERCEEGSWTQVVACNDGCDAAACIQVQTTSSCEQPLSLSVGQTLNASTSGGESNHSWPSQCTTAYGSAPLGPETIHHLSISEDGAYQFELDGQDQANFALYLRRECDDPSTAWSDYCEGTQSAGGTIRMTTVLAKGEYTVFVDDFGLGASGPGRYTLKVSSVPPPICLDQRLTLLDLSSGSATVEGDTADGLSKTRWNQFQCGAPYDTTGKEVSYAFTLYEGGKVRLEAAALEPAESRLGLYLRDACEGFDAQIACAYGDGTAAPFFETELDPGVYYVFVDDFSSSVDRPQTQTFALTVTLL